MIAIINTTEQRASGETKYKVRINDMFVCEFWHLRIKGLAACLENAAEAVKEVDLLKINSDYRLKELKKLRKFLTVPTKKKRTYYKHSAVYAEIDKVLNGDKKEITFQYSFETPEYFRMVSSITAYLHKNKLWKILKLSRKCTERVIIIKRRIVK